MAIDLTWRRIEELPKNIPYIQGYATRAVSSHCAQVFALPGGQWVVTWFDNEEQRVTHFLEIPKMEK